MRHYLIIVLPFLITSCGISDKLDKMDMEKHRSTCVNYGFKEGSESFSNCMLKLDEIENDNIQQSLNRERRKH